MIRRNKKGQFIKGSQYWLGKKRPDIKFVNQKYKLGRRLSEETKLKISRANSGIKSKSWKGGISKLSYIIRTCYLYKKWKQEILERDDYICQICKAKEEEVIVDHYPISFSTILLKYNIKKKEDIFNCKKLWDINNGRSLCLSCNNILTNRLRKIDTQINRVYV